LPEQNIFRDALAIVHFTRCGGFNQNFNSFFKGAAHQSTRFGPIDTVTRDCHQVTLVCHDVAKKRQMTVIDIGTVKFDNVTQFSQKSITRGFDTQRFHNFHDRVGRGSRSVHMIHRQDVF
jgi:hypothetical protein